MKVREYAESNEYQALFYILASNEQLRKNINELYNFDERYIKVDGLQLSFQTSSSTSLILLAFNLYNGYVDEENAACSAPSRLFFNLDFQNKKIALEAIKIYLKLTDV